MGNPLSRSNGIGLGLILAKHLNITAEITNNGDFFELYSLSSPYFFFLYAGVLSIFLLLYWFLSLVVRLIIVQVLVLSEMRAIEVIHIPMWDIIILCPYLIEEQRPLIIISGSFLSIIAIEVIFISTYKTTEKIDREYSGKIIFLIIGIRYACFIFSLHFDAVVALIFSDSCFCL